MGWVMIRLSVPYAEKDQAKALGAKWSQEQKTWYVPEGVLLLDFECWLPKFKRIEEKVANIPKIPIKSKVKKIATENNLVRVNGIIGKVIRGEHYFELDHDCSPFETCSSCSHILESSGWGSGQRAALIALDAVL